MSNCWCQINLSIKYAVLLIMLTACYCFFQFFYPYHLFSGNKFSCFSLPPDFFTHAWQASLIGSIYWRIFNPTFSIYAVGGLLFWLAAFLIWNGRLLFYHILKITSPNRFNRYWARIPPTIDFMSHLGLVNPLSTTVGFIMGDTVVFGGIFLFTKLWLNREVI